MTAYLNVPSGLATMIASREIFRVFLNLGLTAYGGLAMIEPMRRRVVEDRKWLSQDDFLDGVALCQLLPGGKVVQLATYIGYRLQGVTGALAATGAVFFIPAILIIILMPYFQKFKELKVMRPFIQGLLAALVGMLVWVTAEIGLTTIADIKMIGLCLGGAVALIGFEVNLLWVVALTAIACFLGGS